VPFGRIGAQDREAGHPASVSADAEARADLNDFLGRGGNELVTGHRQAHGGGGSAIVESGTAGRPAGARALIPKGKPGAWGGRGGPGAKDRPRAPAVPQADRVAHPHRKCIIEAVRIEVPFFSFFFWENRGRACSRIKSRPPRPGRAAAKIASEPPMNRRIASDRHLRSACAGSRVQAVTQELGRARGAWTSFLWSAIRANFVSSQALGAPPKGQLAFLVDEERNTPWTWWWDEGEPRHRASAAAAEKSGSPPKPPPHRWDHQPDDAGKSPPEGRKRKGQPPSRTCSWRSSTSDAEVADILGQAGFLHVGKKSPQLPITEMRKSTP